MGVRGAWLLGLAGFSLLAGPARPAGADEATSAALAVRILAAEVRLASGPWHEVLAQLASDLDVRLVASEPACAMLEMPAGTGEAALAAIREQCGGGEWNLEGGVLAFRPAYGPDQARTARSIGYQPLRPGTEAIVPLLAERPDILEALIAESEIPIVDLPEALRSLLHEAAREEGDGWAPDDDAGVVLRFWVHPMLTCFAADGECVIRGVSLRDIEQGRAVTPRVCPEAMARLRAGEAPLRVGPLLAETREVDSDAISRPCPVSQALRLAVPDAVLTISPRDDATEPSVLVTPGVYERETLVIALARSLCEYRLRSEDQWCSLEWDEHAYGAAWNEAWNALTVLPSAMPAFRALWARLPAEAALPPFSREQYDAYRALRYTDLTEAQRAFVEELYGGCVADWDATRDNLLYFPWWGLRWGLKWPAPPQGSMKPDDVAITGYSFEDRPASSHEWLSGSMRPSDPLVIRVR